ncbi:MAG: DUF4920 domain-containing protein [Bacteroidia bacterium]|nr:DUF4920 domain-containing protein [Bacteroidia bacterium]
MKKVLVIAASVFVFASCGGNSKPSEPSADSSQAAPVENAEVTASFYGEKITPDSAVSVAELANLMGDKAEMNIKITGEISDVCQKKGCWMEIKNPAGEPVRVTFKDYGFFMPKDASGRTAIMDGIAKVEVTSIADLKEYAKDAGEDKAAIEAIKEPKKELVFEAKGVILN